MAEQISGNSRACRLAASAQEVSVVCGRIATMTNMARSGPSATSLKHFVKWVGHFETAITPELGREVKGAFSVPAGGEI